MRGSKKAWYKKDEVKISQDFGLSVVEAARIVNVVEEGPTRPDVGYLFF